MIKRIGILTFHASHNYGSMLQAYAMQTYLKKRGIKLKTLIYEQIFKKTCMLIHGILPAYVQL